MVACILLFRICFRAECLCKQLIASKEVTSKSLSGLLRLHFKVHFRVLQLEEQGGDWHLVSVTHSHVPLLCLSFWRCMKSSLKFGRFTIHSSFSLLNALDDLTAKGYVDVPQGECASLPAKCCHLEELSSTPPSKACKLTSALAAMAYSARLPPPCNPLGSCRYISRPFGAACAESGMLTQKHILSCVWPQD